MQKREASKAHWPTGEKKNGKKGERKRDRDNLVVVRPTLSSIIYRSTDDVKKVFRRKRENNY